MTSSHGDRGDAARQALAELLGSTEIDITGETAGRLPSGEEVRQVSATVRGEPNRAAAVVVDASGEAQPLRRLEALYGRGFLAPEAVRERPTLTPTPTPPVTIDPPTNEWTLPECVTEDETVTVFVPRSTVPPKADVYLLADTTASMTPIISAVQAGIDTVVNFPFPPFDLAWGVGNYKDFPIPTPNPYAFLHQLAPTTDLAAVTTAVNTWSAADGSDIPEGQLYALTQIATDPAIGWRAGSKRILVWFGDAPGHDPICTAISGTADITEGTATNALVGAQITVVAISTDTGTPGALDGDPTAGSSDYGVCTVGGSPGQATNIATATGGSYTTGVDATTIIDTLITLISAAVQSINHLVLQPTGAIAPFVTSITPPSYDSLAGDVDHTLPFDVTWTGVVDCADEDQVFTGSLDVVADGTVVASKPVTITVPACRWHHSTEMICGLQRGGDDGDKHDECQTVADGRYATAVTIYNPTTCNVTLVKYFAPLILDGKPVGREPRAVFARPFARLELRPGQATLEDCCSLAEAVGPTGGPLVLGVLDIVADHALEVTVTHTANGAGEAATSINARTIRPRRA